MAEPTLFDSKDYLAVDPNPCVVMYGMGPEGKRCGTCSQLVQRGLRNKRHWYKCLLRRSLKDPAQMGNKSTDHRVGWNACSKYIEEKTCR